jgi:membrane-bound lytic murein transglycosylase MltF
MGAVRALIVTGCRLGSAVLFAYLSSAPALAQLSDAESTKGSAPSANVRQLSIANRPWLGDFDKMVQRRVIRVLVPYSRTLYFNDRGRERGITAEAVRDFEQYINNKLKTGKRPITVYLIPTTRDKLLPGIVDGLGDVAAGNLTVTDERLKQVDFVVLTERGSVSELVVTGAKGPKIASVEDLAGKTVHVRKTSSYYESLEALNARLKAGGKPAVKLHLVPDALEDEDMMEMANAGLIDILIVDDWKAKLWAQILPKLRVNDRVAVREGGHIGWAIHKERPKLAEILRQYEREYVRKLGTYAYRLKKEMQEVQQLQDPTRSADWQRFEEIVKLFDRYGERYGFDPLMLAAQGYQESRLRQDAHSRAGAVGVMQLMPQTGAAMKVGDIHVTEANIHAAAKYMDMLLREYFPDAHFSEGNGPLFAFASYNAGPGNIVRMRTEAKRRGLDPDKWFNNVELVVAEKIGLETTAYVRNIYKYYVSYKLALEAEQEQRRARATVAPAGSR